MKQICLLGLAALLCFSSCRKDHFFDKFVPEVLYFQNSDVENPDFREITLAADSTRWMVKARVSAPMKLKEIRLLKISGGQPEQLLQTYTDFQLSPNVFRLLYQLEGINAETAVRIRAIDMNNKITTRDFIIKPAR